MTSKELLQKLQECYDDYCSHPENKYYFEFGQDYDDDPDWDIINLSKKLSFDEFVKSFCQAINLMKKNHYNYILFRCIYDVDTEEEEDEWLEEWELVDVYSTVRRICKKNNWNIL